MHRAHKVGLISRGGGRGVLGLEKGTDCGPSAAELWLSQANNAKKGGLSSHHLDDYKELSNMLILGFYNYIHSELFRKPFKTSNFVKSNQINNEIQ